MLFKKNTYFTNLAQNILKQNEQHKKTIIASIALKNMDLRGLELRALR
jgi:hypothetical protein